jgi:hypothetical protein
MWSDASMTMRQRQRASNQPNNSKIKPASDYGSDDDEGLFFSTFIHEHYARLNTLIDMDLIVQIKVDDALITIAVSLFVHKAHINRKQMYRISYA